jgi:hypothetical protein
MSTPKGINRAIVTLKLPRKVPDLIKEAQGLVTAMTGNPERDHLWNAKWVCWG